MSEATRDNVKSYSAGRQHRLDAMWYMQKRETEVSLSVIRLGLEPKTPTLKVLCSTN